jgi:hypothetical protein
MQSVFEPLKAGRSKVVRTAEGLEVLVPAPFSWIAALFLLIWLIGWTLGGFAVASSVFGADFGIQWKNNHPPGGPFAVVWLCFWVLGEVTVIYQLVWSAFGYERISLTPTALRHDRNILWFERSRFFDLNEIKRLRTSAASISNTSNRYAAKRIRGGSIAFDYGRGTIYLAIGIAEGEAYDVIRQLIASSAILKRQSTDLA